MKNRFLIVLLSWFLISGNTLLAEEIGYVQIKSSKIRSAPKIWASAVASVSYGDGLTIIEKEDNWVKVTSKGKTGYIPASAITPKKVVLASSARVGESSVDPTDAILAGKGFDKGVEAQYAAQSSGNYQAVNAMEKIKVSEAELRAFVIAGELAGGK